MPSEDWSRVEELFHAALDLGGAEREDYLARECGADAGLRREVESLVAASESAHSFIERPVLSLGMTVLSGGPGESLAGRSLGHYRVVRMLDGGGMGGEVYLAEDCLLERPVALKFIANRYAGDGWAKEQAMKEARAVARIEHPNICQVYGVEETDGHHFIVMQYVEGETLAALMRRGRLGRERVLELAEQVVNALAAAHARGIIHRDVKPQNIMVTADGQAKVLDFGLAKLVGQGRGAGLGGGDPAQTLQLGGVVGTPAYMSPEQARGEELDQRSDIFSFGVVLYEMLSGRNPFLRDTVEETISAVAADGPPPLPAPQAGATDALLETARACLAKERARRPETADLLARRLRALRAPERDAGRHARLGVSRARRHLSRHARRYAAAALALLLLASVCTGYVYLKLSKVHTLAVLPIVNESGDGQADYLSKGLTRNLFDKFSYLPRLRIKLPSDAPPDAGERDGLLRVGRELKADAVLSGTITQQDGSLRLHLTLLDTSDASQLWGATFDLGAANLFALQDDITREVAARLGLWLVGDERKLLTKRQTDDEQALRLYMEGQRYYLKRDRANVKKAIELFESACELDPSFAKAYSGLADSYTIAANVAYGPLPPRVAMERARWNARQALETGPLLPEAHVSMGLFMMSYSPERQEAEHEFRRAIELDPHYAPAHYWYSNLLAVFGRFDESVKESEIARGLDPYSSHAEMNYGRALYFARRFDEAEAHLRGLLEKSPDNLSFLRMMGFVLVQQGRRSEAVATLERAYAKDHLHSAAALGYAYGKAGRREDARAILRELDELSTPERPVPPFEKALVYISMGERDAAFEMLERAYQEQFGQQLMFLTTDPLYDDLRSDPRFADLARRLNLTP
jgi:serine/threonine protein kinase/Tfp pilus assembly protein PilF